MLLFWGYETGTLSIVQVLTINHYVMWMCAACVNLLCCVVSLSLFVLVDYYSVVNGRLGTITLQYGDHVLQHIKHTFAGYVYILNLS